MVEVCDQCRLPKGVLGRDTAPAEGPTCDCAMYGMSRHAPDRHWRVRWEVDVHYDAAPTSVDAAIEALRLMRSPDSTATAFQVSSSPESWKPDDQFEMIDLCDELASLVVPQERAAEGELLAQLARMSLSSEACNGAREDDQQVLDWLIRKARELGQAERHAVERLG